MPISCCTCLEVAWVGLGMLSMAGSDKRRDKSPTLLKLKLVSLVMPSYGVRDGGRV